MRDYVANNRRIIEYYRRLINEQGEDFLLPEPEEDPDNLEKWMYNELQRLKILFQEERLCLESGTRWVAGADEVGRGPMAGPVIACAVLIDGFKFLPGLNDSKKIGLEMREMLFQVVEKSPIPFSLGRVEAEEIDRLNIHNASLLAMKRAVKGLPVSPEMIYVDGKFTIPGVKCPQKSVIKGDGKILSIAVASVIAKVTRDREMCSYSEEFPGYGFAGHKGYCTKEHMDALRKIGPCPIHRRSYKPIRELECLAEQLSLV